MTETSPLVTVARAPRGTPKDAEIDFIAKAGRVLAGTEYGSSTRRVPRSRATVSP